MSTPDSFIYAATPLLAGTISLLFALSSRNANIAERLRKCAEQMFLLKCPDDFDRKCCLEEQMRVFLTRFKWNLAALLTLLATIVSLVTMSILAYAQNQMILPQIALGVSFVTLLASVVLASVDFLKASQTLELERNSAIRSWERQTLEVRRETLPSVVKEVPSTATSAPIGPDSPRNGTPQVPNVSAESPKQKPVGI